MTWCGVTKNTVFGSVPYSSLIFERELFEHVFKKSLGIIFDLRLAALIFSQLMLS